TPLHSRPPLFPYTTLFRSSTPSSARPKGALLPDDLRFFDHESGLELTARQIEHAAAPEGDDVAAAGQLHSLDQLTGRIDDVVQRSEEHTSELQSPYDLVCR